jgi:hypothetical protein
VCRCFLGAFRSVSRIASTNSTAAFSFHRGRCVFFLHGGSALPIASRTILRCTPSFLATPVIVPTPNSYSRRICSNSSTLALQSNESPPIRASPKSEYPFVFWVGQIKPPNWAALEYRNQTQCRRVFPAAGVAEFCYRKGVANPNESDDLSEIGVAAINLIVRKDMGWIFRQQTVSDRGIDAEIEILDADGDATGRNFVEQVRREWVGFYGLSFSN